MREAVLVVTCLRPCLFVVSGDGSTKRETKLSFSGISTWPAARRAVTEHWAPGLVQDRQGALPFAAAAIAHLGERQA
jgi:hypothetical protein